jgi:hypothetical protein
VFTKQMKNAVRIRHARRCQCKYRTQRSIHTLAWQILNQPLIELSLRDVDRTRVGGTLRHSELRPASNSPATSLNPDRPENLQCICESCHGYKLRQLTGCGWETSLDTWKFFERTILMINGSSGH